MAEVDIRQGYKDSAWFTANPTVVLKEGQVVHLEQTGLYKIGDGSTTLANLVWQPATIDGGSATTPGSTIKGKSDTAANWTAENPTLEQGEVGLETDTRLKKTGDGSTAWNSLDYDGSEVPEVINRRIFLYYNQDVSTTGGTSAVVMSQTFLIPAGTMGPNSVLALFTRFKKSGTAASCTWWAYAKTTPVAVGQPPGATAKEFGTTGSAFGSSIATMGWSVRLSNKNSLAVNNWYSISSHDFSTPTTAPPQVANINWAVDQYILIVAIPGSAADTNTLCETQIYIDNPL